MSQDNLKPCNQEEFHRDVFCFNDSRWELFEAHDGESKVDGTYVIGRAVGPFFTVNGTSKNKRYYSKEAWERALGKCQPKIDAGMMFGTIGHEQPLNDQALLEGKASHRISRLWIDSLPNGDEIGKGEVLILNTEAGRNLKTYLGSGSRFPVSSRADGKYKGYIGGCLNVDPNSFVIDGFDFVQSPGLIFAVPSLVEDHKDGEHPGCCGRCKENKLSEDTNIDTQPVNTEEPQTNAEVSLETDNKEEEIQEMTTPTNAGISTGGLSDTSQQAAQMTNVMTSLASDKAKLEKDLETSIKECNNLQTQLGVANKLSESQGAQIDALKAELESTKKRLESNSASAEGNAKAQDELTSVKKELQDAQQKLESYKRLGEAEEVQQKVKDVEELEKEFGNPKEIGEALRGSHTIIEAYSKFGSPTRVGTIVRLYEDDNDPGANPDKASPEEVDKAMDSAQEVIEAYSKLGSPSMIREAMEEASARLKAYEDLGTPEEIDTALKRAEESLAAYEDLGTPEEIGQALDQAQEVVNDTEKKKNEDEIEQLADTTGVDKEVSESLLQKFTINEALDILGKVKGSRLSAVYNAAKPTKPANTNESLNESTSYKPIAESGTLAGSLMKKLGR